MVIKGSCHCGNLRFDMLWPEESPDIRYRQCDCSFCRKHGGAWTSHPDAELNIRVRDEQAVSLYLFGTGTADFHVCRVCGVVPFVSSEIEGEVYAVVNVNTFDDVSGLSLSGSSISFDGEGVGDRLDRRKRNWIPEVRAAG